MNRTNRHGVYLFVNLAGPRATMNEPRLNLPELTVSELSTALKRTIEDAYGYVRVRGELGKVSYHGNGHVYFDLKDERASIAGVIWRSVAPASSSSSKPDSRW